MPRSCLKTWPQPSAAAISRTPNNDNEAAVSANRIEWQSLPTLWPGPAVWSDHGDFMLLVFSPEGVPTWEVRHRRQAGYDGDDLVIAGTADTFESAKAAAIFEAEARSSK